MHLFHATQCHCQNSIWTYNNQMLREGVPTRIQKIVTSSQPQLKYTKPLKHKMSECMPNKMNNQTFESWKETGMFTWSKWPAPPPVTGIAPSGGPMSGMGPMLIPETPVPELKETPGVDREDWGNAPWMMDMLERSLCLISSSIFRSISAFISRLGSIVNWGEPVYCHWGCVSMGFARGDGWGRRPFDSGGWSRSEISCWEQSWSFWASFICCSCLTSWKTIHNLRWLHNTSRSSK